MCACRALRLPARLARAAKGTVHVFGPRRWSKTGLYQSSVINTLRAPMPTTYLSAAWCVGMGAWLWFMPMGYDGVTITNGIRQEVTTYRSFSEVSQLGPLPLIIPACVALVAAWAARRGHRVGLGVATLLLAGFTIASGFSIGANYLPAAGALILATLLAAAFGSGSRE